MTQGLYNKQALGKARYDVLCGIMKNDPNPVSAHYAGVEAEQLTREMNLRTLKISDNEFIIGNLQSTIETLSNVILASAQRTLALRHLEDAQSRLIRELGDRPDRESPESPDPTTAHYINEGATLILDGHESRISIPVTEENSALCDAIFNALSI